MTPAPVRCIPCREAFTAHDLRTEPHFGGIVRFYDGWAHVDCAAEYEATKEQRAARLEGEMRRAADDARARELARRRRP